VRDRLDSISKESFLSYLESHGRRGQMVINGLSGLLDSLQMVFETSVGKEILKEDVERCEYLVTLIMEEKATDLEKAEFRYLRSRIIKIGEKLEKYLELVDKIKRG
jgi:hypothetical protein